MVKIIKTSETTTAVETAYMGPSATRVNLIHMISVLFWTTSKSRTNSKHIDIYEKKIRKICKIIIADYQYI